MWGVWNSSEILENEGRMSVRVICKERKLLIGWLRSRIWQIQMKI